MTFLIILFGILYLLLIGSLIYGWRKLPEFQLKHKEPKTGFSIIIPFRNEAENLPELLNSLRKIKYPASYFEILLVNDQSQDTSERICTKFVENHPDLHFRVFQNKRRSNSPKKDAILTAVEKAQFEYLLTTDADCVVPPTWLQAFASLISEENTQLVAGPVRLKKTEQKKPLFHAFEELDVLSLQASGAGGFGLNQPFMCNGANLCYEKQAFLKSGGFSGNDNIASGDDVFLLQKFSEKGLKTVFLKSEAAVVETQPQHSLQQLISQRIRWAAKTPAYTSLFAKTAGMVVFLTNFSLVFGLVLALFRPLMLLPLMLLFFVKFNLDFILIFSAAKFFRREEVMRSYFWSSFVYPFFSTFIAVLSLFKGFDWKGRHFKS
ncbi:MAG: glycosyltransferase [Salegentibacter sp.]